MYMQTLPPWCALPSFSADSHSSFAACSGTVGAVPYAEVFECSTFVPQESLVYDVAGWMTARCFFDGN
jgi:hypothetical protein